MRSNSRNPMMALLLLGMVVSIATSCSGRRKVITDKGVYPVQVGGEMPPAGVRRYKGLALRDTIMEQGDYRWRVAVAKYKEGRVFLEEDFFAPDQLNRIRIETPELALKNGLRVGMGVQNLQETADEWFVVPLPEYRLFDFYTRLFPSIHFLVDDPSHTMEASSWESYKLEDFDPNAKIVAIVVY